MKPQIQIWRSYSCNNSASFRLVARFGDPLTAESAATELADFFLAHAREIDTAFEAGNFDITEQATATDLALAEKYGFTWEGTLFWGDDSQENDRPDVAAVGTVLVIDHPYCNGFGEDVPKFLTARGATDVDEGMGESPMVSVLFRLPPGPDGASLDDELTALFAQMTKYSDVYNWMIKPPWAADNQPSGETDDVAFFTDHKTIAFYLPIAVRQLPALKSWLTDNGVEAPVIRLCEFADRPKITAIANARCTACASALEYLDPRTHGIESEQLACTACGAMFELSTFLSGPSA